MASGGVLVTLDCEIRWRDLSEEVRCKVDGWEGGYVCQAGLRRYSGEPPPVTGVSDLAGGEFAEASKPHQPRIYRCLDA